MFYGAINKLQKKIKKWIEESYSKVIETLKRSPEKTTEVSAIDDPGKKLERLLARVDESCKHIDLHFVPEEEQSEIHSHVRQLAMEGFHNGVVRLKTSSSHSTAEYRAGCVSLRCMATLAEKGEAIETKVKVAEQMQGDKKSQISLSHNYQKYVHHHYKFNERGYTKLEFWVYLICYIILFVADIPLSAEMLKCLYDVNMNEHAITLFPIQQNANVKLIAIGLGISTIFIKYCYDELVAKKYGHAVISHKKFIEVFSNSGSVEFQNDEILAIKRNAKIERIIKVSLLLFTIATIIVLGVFRGFAWLQLSNDEEPVSLFWVTATMIFITLLFALIGGVCLSLSLTAYTNSSRLGKSKKEASLLEKEFVDCSNELAELKGKLNYNKECISRIGDGVQFRQMITGFFNSFYNMGFDEGSMSPGYFMDPMPFFDRVLHWREQAISVTINSNITKQPILS